jgi:hypothetical protein
VETGAISTASPARQSGVPPGSPGKARMGRKCRLFVRSTSSLHSQTSNCRAQNGASLRPYPQIFPFCRDCRRRPGSITPAARAAESNRSVSSPRKGRIGCRCSFTAARGWRSSRVRVSLSTSKSRPWRKMRFQTRISSAHASFWSRKFKSGLSSAKTVISDT